MKTGILIDSTFYVGSDFIKDNTLRVIPLSVNFENKSYVENKSFFDLYIQYYQHFKI